jgi:hypothetical protein
MARNQKSQRNTVLMAQKYARHRKFRTKNFIKLKMADASCRAVFQLARKLNQEKRP